MTSFLLPYFAQMGLAGLVFLALMAFMQLGLTQFIKTFAWQTPAGEKHLRGPWVLALSLLVGAVLGGVMLSKVARLMDITVPEPWSGVLAGMILAATVSGVISWMQQRTAEKAGAQTDAITAILAQVAAAQPYTPPVQVQTPGPVTVAPPVAPVLVPEPIPPETEALRPITPAEAEALGESNTR